MDLFRQTNFSPIIFIFLAAEYTRLYVGKVKCEITLKEENLWEENDRNLKIIYSATFRDILFQQLLIFFYSFLFLKYGNNPFLHFPSPCLHLRVFFPVVVINFKMFVQLSAFSNRFFFLFQQFVDLNFCKILTFEFPRYLIPATLYLKVAKVFFSPFTTFFSHEIFFL